jgi:hypothetical protein
MDPEAFPVLVAAFVVMVIAVSLAAWASIAFLSAAGNFRRQALFDAAGEHAVSLA